QRLQPRDSRASCSEDIRARTRLRAKRASRCDFCRRTVAPRQLPDLDLPLAVLGILADFDARVPVAEHQDLAALVVFARLGLAPLVGEQREQRVARVGVRLERHGERDLADAAVVDVEEELRRRAIPFGRQEREDQIGALAVEDDLALERLLYL